MCFGSKDESNDAGPKPVPLPQQQPTSSARPPSKGKTSQEYAAPQGPPPSHAAGSSNHYAPPPGPPPGSRPDNDYAPPVGPPPPHSRPSGDHVAPPPGPPPGARPGEEYAPPSGPPPGSRSGDDYAPPSGPPPGARSGDDYAPPPGPPPGSRPGDDYAPPSGPPPGARPEEDYAPPVGPPPPGHRGGGDDYAAPPGPPPPRQDYGPPPGPPPSKGQNDDYGPPPGPPPSKGHNDDYGPPPGPPPSDPTMSKKHNWEEAVPEAPLAPPPNIWGGHDFSWANNATEEQANAGEEFCRLNPLRNQPEDLDGPTLQALQQSNFNLICQSPSVSLAPVALGVWKGHSREGTTDTSVIAWPPIYSVKTHSPFATGRPKVIYYEVHFTSDCPREIGFALGFAALPYPPFRLPGWHRGSLGVHGDDGHKYINDLWGGKDFTEPFRRGETVGLGMEIAPGPGGGVTAHVFLTRDGREAGRWDLHEETDREQDRPVTGLEGFHDLCATVGMFEKTSFEIVFAPWRWKWQGHQGQ